MEFFSSQIKHQSNKVSKQVTWGSRLSTCYFTRIFVRKAIDLSSSADYCKLVDYCRLVCYCRSVSWIVGDGFRDGYRDLSSPCDVSSLTRSHRQSLC